MAKDGFQVVGVVFDKESQERVSEALLADGFGSVQIEPFKVIAGPPFPEGDHGRYILVHTGYNPMVFQKAWHIAHADAERAADLKGA